MKHLTYKIAAGIIFILLLLFCLVRSGILSDFIIQSILAKINSADLSLSIEKSKFSMSKSSFNNVKIILNGKLPVSLVIECTDVDLDYGIPSVFTSRSFLFHASCYDGKIDGSFTNGIIKIDKITDLDLSKQSNLSDFGLISGKLAAVNGVINKHEIDFDKISLINLNSKAPIKLPGLITGLPGDITLPVENFNLEFKLKNPHLQITEINHDSSLAKVSGYFEIVNSLNGKVNLDINMKPAGTLLFGNFLPLVSSNVLKNTSTNFNIKVDGSMFEAKYTENLL